VKAYDWETCLTAQQYDVRGGSSDVMYGQADAAGRIAEAILRKFGLEPKENL
jgi:hypothetical protein